MLYVFLLSTLQTPSKKNLFIPLQKVTGTNENHVLARRGFHQFLSLFIIPKGYTSLAMSFLNFSMVRLLKIFNVQFYFPFECNFSFMNNILLDSTTLSFPGCLSKFHSYWYNYSSSHGTLAIGHLGHCHLFSFSHNYYQSFIILCFSRGLYFFGHVLSDLFNGKTQIFNTKFQ